MIDWAPNRDGDTMGGRIGRMRETLHLSDATLASQLGVDVSSIEAWERDQAEPPVNELIVLAGILGVSPAWLLGGYGEDGTVVDLDEAGRLAKIETLRQRRDVIDREIVRLEELNRGEPD